MTAQIEVIAKVMWEHWSKQSWESPKLLAVERDSFRACAAKVLASLVEKLNEI